jgi:hypothetical protein
MVTDTALHRYFYTGRLPPVGAPFRSAHPKSGTVTTSGRRMASPLRVIASHPTIDNHCHHHSRGGYTLLRNCPPTCVDRTERGDLDWNRRGDAMHRPDGAVRRRSRTYPLSLRLTLNRGATRRLRRALFRGVVAWWGTSRAGGARDSEMSVRKGRDRVLLSW